MEYVGCRFSVNILAAARYICAAPVKGIRIPLISSASVSCLYLVSSGCRSIKCKLNLISVFKPVYFLASARVISRSDPHIFVLFIRCLGRIQRERFRLHCLHFVSNRKNKYRNLREIYCNAALCRLCAIFRRYSDDCFSFFKSLYLSVRIHRCDLRRRAAVSHFFICCILRSYHRLQCHLRILLGQSRLCRGNRHTADSYRSRTIYRNLALRRLISVLRRYGDRCRFV